MMHYDALCDLPNSTDQSLCIFYFRILLDVGKHWDVDLGQISVLRYKCLVNFMPVKRNNFCCYSLWLSSSTNLIIMILTFLWKTTKNISLLLSGLYVSGMQNKSQTNWIYITITFLDLSPDKLWKLPGGVV